MAENCSVKLMLIMFLPLHDDLPLAFLFGFHIVEGSSVVVWVCAPQHQLATRDVCWVPFRYTHIYSYKDMACNQLVLFKYISLSLTHTHTHTHTDSARARRERYRARESFITCRIDALHVNDILCCIFLSN